MTINPALEIATDMVDSIITFNIGGAFGDGSVRVETQRVALDQLNQQFGQLSASGLTTKALIMPGDDFCGTPWPWPFPGGDPRRVVEVINPDIWGAKGAASKTTLGIFRALTLYATAAVFQDIRQGEAMQQLALGQVNKGLQTLAKQIG